MSTQSADVLAKLARSRGAEPSQLGNQLRGELDWIVIRTLEKDRNRRYETANGLARDVQRYLAGEAVEACPPTLGYRFRKFAARHRAQVAVGSVLLVTLLLGIAGTTFGLIRAQRSANLARRAQGIAERERENAQAAADRESQRRGELGVALSRSQKLHSQLVLGRVPDLIGEQNYPEALLWLAHALELAPADDADLQHYIRTNLDALSSEIAVPRLTMPIKSTSLQPMAVSPDGNTIASADQDPDSGQYVVRLWKAGNGVMLDMFEVGQAYISCLSFSPDSKQILVGTGSYKPPTGGIALWSTETRKLKQVPEPLEGKLLNLAFAPDGQSFYSASAVGLTYVEGGKSRVQRWQASDCKPDGEALLIEGSLYGIALHPDGNTFVGLSLIHI